MNKNDKDSHLGAFGELFSIELSQKEMVSTEQPPTSVNPENNKEALIAGIRGEATAW